MCNFYKKLCLQIDPFAIRTLELKLANIFKNTSLYHFQIKLVLELRFLKALLFASVLFSDAHKVEAHKRRRSTCRSKFLFFKKKCYILTSCFKEAFTKYGA
jgi:hypothetical protein